MRNRKKFKTVKIIFVISVILFETIECIRVPTDWSEIRPEHINKAKQRVAKQVYQTSSNSQRRISHTLTPRNSPSLNNDPGGHNPYGFPKKEYSTIPFISNKNPSNQLYSRAHLRPGPYSAYAKIPPVRNYNNVPLIALTKPDAPVYVKPYQYIPQPKSKAYVTGNHRWVPLQTINKQYKLAPILTSDKTYSKPLNKNGENETYKPLKTQYIQNDEDKKDIRESEPPELIPQFANKIYENVPFAAEQWKEEGIQSKSLDPENYKSDQENHKSDQENEKSDQEENLEDSETNQEENSEDTEDPEQYQVPQDETPISDHEYPLEIPTKPIYPGEGQWAIPGRRYRVFQRPELPKIRSEDEEDRPDGYEIFEDGEKQFNQANAKYQSELQQFPKKHNLLNNYQADPSTDSGSAYRRDPGFIPLKMYAQVRKTETTKHLPQSEAYKEAATEEELINAPRLREVVKNTRAHTVYTEEGYEDEAYDHGGHEKNAENHEDFRNLERDLEDAKEQTRKRENSRHGDNDQHLDGAENKEKIIEQNLQDNNRKTVQNKEFLEASRDAKSSGTEHKHNIKPLNHNNEKLILAENPRENKDRGWSKSQVTKETKQTVVKMGDGIVDTKIKNEIEMIKNPGGPGMKKYKYISITTPEKSRIQPQSSKDLEDTITTLDSTTNSPIYEFYSINPTAFNVFQTENNDATESLDEIFESTDYYNKEATTLNSLITTDESDVPTVTTLKPLKLKKQKKNKKKLKNYKVNDISKKISHRVKRYDREKLSKIYIRKRPNYYWEKSKNRGNTKIEFRPNVLLKKSLNDKNIKTENKTANKSELDKKAPPKTVNKLNKTIFKSRFKRNLNLSRSKRFQINHPSLNFDELRYDIVDVSKFPNPTPKPDLTHIKYPYYLMAKKGTINKDSPLQYAEDLRRIPVKTEGDMSFYKSTASVQCPEVEPNVDPIPDRIKNKEVKEEDTENQSDDIDKKVQPLQQVQRLKGLGDKIDCMKVKYFGENPLDSPFFKEEIIEEPSIDSVFPHLRTKEKLQKQSSGDNFKISNSHLRISKSILGKTNIATTEKIETATTNSEDNGSNLKIENSTTSQWISDKIKMLAGYLNNSTLKDRQRHKRDISSSEESRSVHLDTIIVVDEELTPDNDEPETEKIIVVNKSETSKLNDTTTAITTESDVTKVETESNRTETKINENAAKNKSESIIKVNRISTERNVLTTTEVSKKNKVSDFILSHLSTLRPDDSEEITTPPSLIPQTVPTTTRRPVISTTVNPAINEISRQKRRRRPSRTQKPSVNSIPQKSSRKIHFTEKEQPPDNFLIIIDTNGENIADVPLQLPLVADNQFTEVFDINKYFPKLDLNPPNVKYEFETQSFKTKTPSKVQMEVFADILQHLTTTTTTVKPKTRRPTQKFTRQTSTEKYVEPTQLVINVEDFIESESNNRKRKIKIPPKRARIKIRNNSTENDDLENQSNNDLPASGTEEHYVKEALEVEDLNKDNPQFKYPGTFKTLYLQDDDNIHRDVYTPEDHYKDVPEYSSDPDHTSATYEHEPDLTHNDDYSYNTHEENGYLNHLQYDLIYNRAHKAYLLRPVKNIPFKPNLSYNSGFRPLPNYSPEFKPIVENEFEEVLIHGLKPVRQGNSLQLVVPYSKLPKQYVHNLQTTLTLRPVTSHKNIRQPVRVIRFRVKPKKVIRIQAPPPKVRLVVPKVHVLPFQVAQPIAQPIVPPLFVPYHFHRHKVTTKQANYYNIEGMVPPLVHEPAIDYSNYQPATFSASSNHPQNHDIPVIDSIADENHLNRKSFKDLQMESSDNLATIVDIKGRPITQAQRKYMELDRLNRQANLYKKSTETETSSEEISPMEGEVLMLKESSSQNVANVKRFDENSTKLKLDNSKLKDKEKLSLRDSYGNVINKPLLNGYSSVVDEMSNESKKYITEAHQPIMNISTTSTSATNNRWLPETQHSRRKIYHKNSSPFSTSTATSVVITSIDSRRNEPKYENRIQSQRLPVTNHRRYKHTSSTPQSESELSIFKTLNTPEVFDINHFIPDTELKRNLRQNHSLHHYSSSRHILSPNNDKHETNGENRKYSSRFNSAAVQLPLSAEKTLQKPVVLVIEEKIRPGSEVESSQNIDKPESINIPDSTPTIASLVTKFKRKRPIPIVRTTSSISTTDTTETSIRKTFNRPRTLQYLRNSKDRHTDQNPSLPDIDYRKEHSQTSSIVNRANRFNTKSVRTNANNSKREKLVVDPIQLRHKARADAEAEARERIKEKLAESENNTKTKKSEKLYNAKISEDITETPESVEVQDKLFIDNEDSTNIEASTPELPESEFYSTVEDEAQKRIDNTEDNEDDSDEEDELLNKDYSDQVEIIGNLEQIRSGPKHGGNYRHINDQNTGYTNLGGRTANGYNFDDDDEDTGEDTAESYEGEHTEHDFSETKPAINQEKPEKTNIKIQSTVDDDFSKTSSFYSDRNLPKHINNLKHTLKDLSLTLNEDEEYKKKNKHDMHEDSSESISKLITINTNSDSKPSTVSAKIIKDPSMRKYFYVKEK